MTETVVAAPTDPQTPGLPRILLVDDEPAVVDGLRRQLRRQFEVHTATSGADGLLMLEQGTATNGDVRGFAVVVSDMRMPHMDGAAFLTLARKSWPDTTRVLLTGYSDMESTIAVVNEGQIFRFLTKPCATETLTTCLHDAVEQNRLVLAERELLEQTLRGCVQALTECLSLANPIAFARAVRVRDFVNALADTLDVTDRWVPEVTAVLSQLGAVTLPESVADKLDRGAALTPGEQAKAHRLPVVAQQLLAGIPRLEAIRDGIRWQDQRFDGNNRVGPAGTDIPLAARLLRLALDIDSGLAGGTPPAHVLGELRERGGAYDPGALAALVRIAPFRETEPTARRVTLGQLVPGDRIDADIRTTSDTLLVGRGTLVTEQILERLNNYNKQTPIRQPLHVLSAAQTSHGSAPAGSETAGQHSNRTS